MHPSHANGNARATNAHSHGNDCATHGNACTDADRYSHAADSDAGPGRRTPGLRR